jgi:predicted AlkP superfamily pyrophosphatase or phosphodiesterase
MIGFHEIQFKTAALTLLLTFVSLDTTITTIAMAQARSSVRPTALRVKRVLLLSLDGLHALDLANYVKAKPKSSLAQLSQHGITYTNAHTSLPSNSWPGLLAMVTGGSPLFHGRECLREVRTSLVGLPCAKLF